MSTLYEKIEACYTAQGKNRKNFAAEIGVPESTIRNWQRYNSVPAADVLYKIAQYFKVPMEYFLEGSENPMSDREIATIIKMRKLSEEQLRMISSVIDKFVEDNKNPEN